MTEGSFEVKLPTYGQMQQQMWEKLETRESVERRSIKVREKVEKSRNTLFFQCFAERSCGMRDQQLHAAVVRSTFGSQDLSSGAL